MNDGAAVKCDAQAIGQADVLLCADTFKERCARGFIHCEAGNKRDRSLRRYVLHTICGYKMVRQSHDQLGERVRINRFGIHGDEDI